MGSEMDGFPVSGFAVDGTKISTPSTTCVMARADSSILTGTTTISDAQVSTSVIVGLRVGIDSQGFACCSARYFGWSSSASAPFVAADTFLTRGGVAANIRQGNADAAAPVAQTSSVQSVVAGTSNTAGVTRTISGSQGTGTGAGGSILFTVAPAGASGTAQNALVTALTIDSTLTTIPAGPVRLKNYTVATLPATPTQGDTAFVTDATAPTYLAIVAGGGAVVAPVLYNGTNWVTH